MIVSANAMTSFAALTSSGSLLSGEPPAEADRRSEDERNAERDPVGCSRFFRPWRACLSARSLVSGLRQVPCGVARRLETRVRRFLQESHHDACDRGGVLDSPAPLVEKIESNETSWMLNVSYAIGDDAMLYASASNGYKSGGVVTHTLQNGLPDRYGPEYVTAFEAGGKSLWLSGRLTLNAAAFFYDYKDFQVSTASISNGQPVFGVDNAAKARLYGIDATTSYEFAKRWSLSGGVVWIDPHVPAAGARTAASAVPSLQNVRPESATGRHSIHMVSQCS